MEKWNRLLGMIFVIFGGIIMGNFWDIIGICCIVAGYNLLTVDEEHERRVVKDWLGNEHLED